MSVKSDSPIRPGLVDLAEDDLPLGPMQRAPLADAPLDRAPDAGTELGMTAQNLLEDRDRPQPGRRLEHRHDLGVEDARQRIGAPPVPRGTLL
jgi:hypothetical protein